MFSGVPDSVRQACCESLRDLDRFGIYVLTTGELESLFEESGVEHSHNSDVWLNQSLSFIRQNDVSELNNNPNVSDLMSFLCNQSNNSSV